MREVKFRGKRLDNGKWVVGSLTQIALIDETSIVDWDSPSYTRCEVDPETVGQYTGLHDKSGTEIYEGDILHYLGYDLTSAKPCIVTVTWSNVDARFWFGGMNPQLKYEVIGNIYENPELLTPAKEAA